jgi:predicted ribosome quality control (RQC) complex YloA/Tae2 family protein
MRLYELQAIAKRLGDFKYINKARRIEDNTIELIFDKEHSYFFNLTRGQSKVYKTASKRPLQSYSAPFDMLLYNHLAGGRVVKVEVVNNDRVLRITVTPKSSYKDRLVHLQLEFTGKNSNAILVDDNEVVLEALRHIDVQSSFRIVRPGVELLAIPFREQKQEECIIEDIDAYLYNHYEGYHQKQLEAVRKQKLHSVLKKKQKLQNILDGLPSSVKLEEEAKEYQNYAHIVLANLYQINPYDKVLKTHDFEGRSITIVLPKDIQKNRLSDYYFNLSKRAKNRVENLYIEKENLESKVAFYENVSFAIEQAKTLYELELLVPKRVQSKRKKEKFKDAEIFWIEDYKVLIGRNSSENQKLLAYAKANDVWMHVKDVPSSHLIIRTDKQNLPQSVLVAAAKLCVDFSVRSAGNYEVDYTKRKFVKIQEGSHVLYTHYETILVLKEGVEIRV